MIAPIAAFSGVVASTLITATHGVLLVAAAGVFAGGAVGFVNGVLIARWRINSLIVTLATMEVVRGLAFVTSNGDAVMISEERFFALGSGSFVGISFPIWSNIVGFVAFGLLLRKTVFVRHARVRRRRQRRGGAARRAARHADQDHRVRAAGARDGLRRRDARLADEPRRPEDVGRPRARRDFRLRAGRRRDDFGRARRRADRGFGAGRDEPAERADVLPISDTRRPSVALGAVRPVSSQSAARDAGLTGGRRLGGGGLALEGLSRGRMAG
ncbi:branched-chain amino acid transport system / permease component family protein [Burkholderia pseudomallei MSHR5613]|nr:branched-chain amino acid transport system / permease component family protein [Burkholderia pseudomallei MSHR5613]